MLNAQFVSFAYFIIFFNNSLSIYFLAMLMRFSIYQLDHKPVHFVGSLLELCRLVFKYLINYFNFCFYYVAFGADRQLACIWNLAVLHHVLL